MTQFAADSFAGVAGTELSAYNAAWVRHALYPTAPCVISTAGRLRTTASVLSVYVRSEAPPSADYSVSCDLVLVSADNSANGPIGRSSSAAATFYHARYAGNASQIQLYKFVAGSAVLLGSASRTLVAGATLQLRLDMSGSTIRVYADGAASPVITQTDTAISSAGLAGLRCSTASGSDAAGLHIDNFSADAAGAAVITGSGDIVLSPVATSAAGAVTVSGQASAQLAPVTTSAAGAVGITGQASATLAPVTSTATGTVSQVAPITGAGAVVLGAVIGVATGTVAWHLPDRPAEGMVRAQPRVGRVRGEPRVQRLKFVRNVEGIMPIGNQHTYEKLPGEILTFGLDFAEFFDVGERDDEPDDASIDIEYPSQVVVLGVSNAIVWFRVPAGGDRGQRFKGIISLETTSGDLAQAEITIRLR